MSYGQLKSPSDYWESCQIFRPLRILVAVPTDGLRKAVSSFRQYGTAVTVAATRSITITTAAAVSFVVNELERQIGLRTIQGEFERLDFDNYLRIAPETNSYSLDNGIWSQNGSVVFDILWKSVFSPSNPHIQQNLCHLEKVACCVNYRSKYHVVKETTSQLYKGHRNCLKEAHKGRANIPSGWAFHNIPFQAAATDPTILKSYAKLWTTPSPMVEQRITTESDISYYVLTDWLNTFVFPAHYYAMKIVASDLAIEERIVRLLRSPNRAEDDESRAKYLMDPSSEYYFKFADWEPISSLMEGSCGKGIRLWGKRFGNIIDKISTLYPSGAGGKSEILNRLEALISAGLLKDLFETIARLGYNPKLKVDREEGSGAAFSNAVKQYLE